MNFSVIPSSLRRSVPAISFTAWLAGVAALGAACSGDDPTVTLKGRITDSQSTQPQALMGNTADASGTSLRPLGALGGSGTVSAATRVTVSSIGDDGSLTVRGEGTLESDGRYTVAATIGARHLILRALDNTDAVVASVIVEATASTEATQTVSPMNTETSVEAQVLVAMAARGTSVAQLNAVDLRARIDGSTAQAVRNAGAEAATAKIDALADAVAVAQRAAVLGYTYVPDRVVVSQAELFEATLGVSQRLNFRLDAADAPDADIYNEFFDNLRLTLADAGAQVQAQSQSETCASAAFSAAVALRLNSGETVDPVADAAARSAGGLEARVSAGAIGALLDAANAANLAKERAVTAAGALRGAIVGATTAEAVAPAFETYRVSVTGASSTTASVLGAYLGVDALTELPLQTSAGAAGTAGAEFRTVVDTALTELIGAAGAIDVEVVGTRIAEAHRAYGDAVRAQAETLRPTYGAQTTVTADVLVIASGSARPATP